MTSKQSISRKLAAAQDRPVVAVPDLTDPTRCFKPCISGPMTMARCGFKKGHAGRHAWEQTDGQLPQPIPRQWDHCDDLEDPL